MLCVCPDFGAAVRGVVVEDGAGAVGAEEGVVGRRGGCEGGVAGSVGVGGVLFRLSTLWGFVDGWERRCSFVRRSC